MSGPTPVEAAAPAFDTTRNVRLLYAYSAAMGLLLFLPVWVIYLTDLRGLSLAQVGLLEAFFWAVAIVAEVPTGAFADRFGRRLAFVLSSIVQGVALAMFGLADGFPLLLSSYVLWAVGIAFASGNEGAYLYEALAAGRREGEFSAVLGRLTAVGTAATMVGAISGAGIAAMTSLQVPILLSAALFLAGLPMALTLHEPPRRPREQRPGYAQTLRDSASALRRDPAAAFIVLFGASFAIANTAGLLLTQPFLQRHSVPVGAFGFFIAANRLLGVGGSLVAYRIPRLFGFARTMALLVAAPAAALMLMGVIDHVIAFAGFATTALAFSVRNPLTVDYLNRRTASDIRATVLSVEPLLRSATFAALLPVVGLAAERSLNGTLFGLGVLLAAVAGAAYLLWLRADRAAARAADDTRDAAGGA